MNSTSQKQIWSLRLLIKFSFPHFLFCNFSFLKEELIGSKPLRISWAKGIAWAIWITLEKVRVIFFFHPFSCLLFPASCPLSCHCRSATLTAQQEPLSCHSLPHLFPLSPISPEVLIPALFPLTFGQIVCRAYALAVRPFVLPPWPSCFCPSA